MSSMYSVRDKINRFHEKYCITYYATLLVFHQLVFHNELDGCWWNSRSQIIEWSEEKLIT